MFRAIVSGLVVEPEVVPPGNCVKVNFLLRCRGGFCCFARAAASWLTDLMSFTTELHNSH